MSLSSETLQALLAAQPPVVYDKLYGGSPFVCKAMLQSLRPLARNYVMRLLFVTSVVPLSELSDWNKASASEEHKQAIEEFIAVQFLFDRQWKAIRVGQAFSVWTDHGPEPHALQRHP